MFSKNTLHFWRNKNDTVPLQLGVVKNKGDLFDSSLLNQMSVVIVVQSLSRVNSLRPYGLPHQALHARLTGPVLSPGACSCMPL